MRNMWLFSLIVVTLIQASCDSKQETINYTSELEDSADSNIRAVVIKDDFIYRLVTEMEEYREDETVSIYAELEYIGDNKEVIIYHASSPFYYSMFELTREFGIPFAMDQPGLRTILVRGEPLREEYKRAGITGLYEDEEEYENFIKKFIKDGFPDGHYRLSGSAKFHVESKKDGEVEKVDYKLKAEIEFKVVE